MPDDATPPEATPNESTEERTKAALALYGALKSTVGLLAMHADESTAKNYVAINLSGFVWGFDRVELTLVRPGGSTPHERVAKLLVEVETLRDRVRVLEERNARLAEEG